MKTFIPAHNFTAYPHDKRVDFVEGVEAGPYSEEFIDLMVEKGHVAGKPHEPKKGAKRPTYDPEADPIADVPVPADPTLPADIQND